MSKPQHPGILLNRRFIIDRLSIVEAAKRLGVSRLALNNFISGRTACDPALASRLSLATDTRPVFWLMLQANHDAYHAEQLKKTISVERI